MHVLSLLFFYFLDWIEVVDTNIWENYSEPEFKMPIASISSVLDIDTINSHLDKLSIDQLKELYGEYLPESIAANPTKEEIMRAIRSGFFQQCEQKLSELLRSNTGAGYLMSQSLKYDYKGEGVDGFLNGIRDLAKKEQDNDKDEEMKWKMIDFFFKKKPGILTSCG